MDDLYKFLKVYLSISKVNLLFKKKSGESRSICCTLNFDIIPSDKIPESKTKRPVNKEYIAVFDLQKQDWRSFRLDSIVYIENYEISRVKELLNEY